MKKLSKKQKAVLKQLAKGQSHQASQRTLDALQTRGLIVVVPMPRLLIRQGKEPTTVQSQIVINLTLQGELTADYLDL